jgi:hypothetical protein
MTVREKFSTTIESINSIVAKTPPIYNFIFVDPGLPEHIVLPDFIKVINSDSFVPQINRFKVINEIKNNFTKYTVFLDNDVIVQDNWLTKLIECAEQTNAGIVGPVYLWNTDKIHMFGGTIRITNKNFYEHHDHVNSHKNILSKLKRKKCDYVEYHCLMIKTELIDLIDPNYKCIHEHIDLSLKAKEKGYTTYTEPLSVIEYLNNAKLEPYDIPFYKKRWNIDDCNDDIKYFCKKWDLLDNNCFGNIRNFINRHSKI